jgi:hypothetical protein
MVTPDPKRQDKESCSLQRVQELAAQGAVIYASETVQRDVDTLQYDFEDVCATLRMLSPEDFHHAELYEDAKQWVDVYKVKVQFQRSSDSKVYIDALYVKFKLNRNCVLVVVHSFHEHRYL